MPVFRQVDAILADVQRMANGMVTEAGASR
jgi:hypothetical protein